MERESIGLLCERRMTPHLFSGVRAHSSFECLERELPCHGEGRPGSCRHGEGSKRAESPR